MKTLATLVAGVLAASFGLVGCSGGETGKLDQGYMQNAEEIGKSRREVFVKAGGDYNALTPEDKKTYLDSFKGDETQAQKFWDFMKNPPSSTSRPGMPSR